MSAAVSQAQPLGFAGGEKIEGDTFAMYGFDIMLTDDFKPVILEINFAPDCTRACQVKTKQYRTKRIITHFYSMIPNL